MEKKMLRLAYHTSLTWKRWINQTKCSHIWSLVGHWGCLWHLWLAITSWTFEKNRKLLWWPRKQKLFKHSVEFCLCLDAREPHLFFLCVRHFFQGNWKYVTKKFKIELKIISQVQGVNELDIRLRNQINALNLQIIKEGFSSLNFAKPVLFW